MSSKQIERIIYDLLVALEEDPTREGLRETPARVARAYTKLLEGYKRNLKDEITVFENTEKYNDIIVSGQIDFFSTCEHHLLPFFGQAYIGYIPNKKIIGLSKLARAIDIYSRRLQDQERITVQVAEELMKTLAPKGVAVLLVSKHFCNMARGVEKKESNMKTIIYRGVFEEDQKLQEKFQFLASNFN